MVDLLVTLYERFWRERRAVYRRAETAHRWANERRRQAPAPRAEIGETEPHPQAPSVPAERKVLLFDAKGQPLARRIGYRP